jgi:hypothetical protein
MKLSRILVLLVLLLVMLLTFQSPAHADDPCVTNCGNAYGTCLMNAAESYDSCVLQPEFARMSCYLAAESWISAEEQFFCEQVYPNWAGCHNYYYDMLMREYAICDDQFSLAEQNCAQIRNTAENACSNAYSSCVNACPEPTP